jgi:hypothetical protein
MRNIILATLLVAATGCASARQSWHARYDHTHPNGALPAGVATPSMALSQPVNVSRCTESGSCGGAGVGPHSN